MDVNMINTNVALGVNSLKTAVVNQAEEFTMAEITTKSDDGTVINSVKDVTQLSSKDVKNITQELNKFLELMNSDLKFVIHEKTKQLIVQVVDTRTQKVLKEFPPHEFLDTMAKIRDYVGLLLDKKV